MACFVVKRQHLSGKLLKFLKVVNVTKTPSLGYETVSRESAAVIFRIDYQEREATRSSETLINFDQTAIFQTTIRNLL